MRKQQLYQLHRLLSFLIGIPVFLWAVSGLLHPLMTSVRPSMATQSPPVDTIPTDILRSPLRPILAQMDIQDFYSSQLVKIDACWYYQVLLKPRTIPIYIEVTSGRQLPGGDKLYAKSLAKHFLTDTASAPPIKAIDYLSTFSEDYSYVNRILPVYKVRFDRPDGICIYVSTTTGKFSFAGDNHRKTFNRFFAFFHTWSWMDRFPKIKALIISCILLLTLFTIALGLYFAFTTRAKKKKGHRLLTARKMHRLTALLAVIFMIAWASSGVIHVIANSQQNSARGEIIAPEQTKTAALPINTDLVFDSLLSNLTPIYTGKEYISIQGQPYLRLMYQKTTIDKKQDLLKDMQVERQPMLYINLQNNTLLSQGDRYYSLWLARQYLHDKSISWKTPAAKQLFAFDASYNFSDKILPVWKINPDGSLAHSVFVDTKSRELTKQGSRFAQIDAYAFAFFHKHEFMAWAGKGAKDTSTIIGVLLVMTMLVFGYRLYFISYKKRRKK